MTKKYIISWEEFHQDVDSLGCLLPSRPWKGIIAVARGGLIPAGILSHKLNIRHVMSLSIASYDEHHQQHDLRFLETLSLDQEGDGWLIVDDLVDSGNTFYEIKKYFPQATLVAVYGKPKGQPAAHIFGRSMDQDTWIVFPWEVNP
jgi:xanthine phosphoribosyltransferase